ncbi:MULTISPECIES: ATP-binding protein [Sulfurimonas]|uniref:PAS domain-containing sensor histidine kinase n=1 Tax=Sulfurimonas TaxID=202746 RepID=UPI001264B530|nr:ATP-binding protein [Sulfurimonas indica]
MAQNEAQHNFRTTSLEKKIVSAIDNGIIILDSDLVIHHYNKWMEIHTHIKEKDALGKKLTELFDTIKEKTLLRKVKTALRMQTPTFYTATTSHYLIPIKTNQIKNSFFSYMQQDVSIVPFDAQNQLVVLILTDQTNMANINALLNAHVAKIKELNEQLMREKELTEMQHKQLLANSRSAAMGEMISMIAHQWRQPLSLITTLLTNIKIKKELQTLDEANMESSLGKIENTVKYLSDTINDFRDYFKPNKVKSDLKLSELFNKSIFFLKDEMNQYNIEYTINIDKQLSIKTYKNELLQSIINIIKNSIDAFKNSDIEDKKIEVSIQEFTYHISIIIEDNAGGIDESILEKIFEPYFSTKNKNGTGLGLYMCKVIIYEHLHGEISITSENNGTKVAIKLPKKI